MGAYAVDYIKQKDVGEWDIKRAVQSGCKAAALAIQRLGAMDAIPWADEVAFVQK